jgi:putative hemolysin
MNAVLALQLLGLGLLLVGSAFFSGTETTLFSLSKLQLRRLRQQSPDAGRLIAELLEQPHRLLSTILMGNTIINISVAVLGYSLLRRIAPAHAELLAVPVMTGLLLVCGEAAPKTLAIRNPELFALYLARPTWWVVKLTAGARHFAETVSGRLAAAVERLAYFASQKPRSSAPTEDEYLTLLRASEQAGIVHKEERNMVGKILALENMQVKEVMTPRVDMQCVEDSWTRNEIAEALRRFKHRRVPLIHETPDHVEGILNVKEFLIDPDRDLAGMIEKPEFVPETMSVARLLKSFRNQEHPVAIVVDEHGGTQGMVTLEDVLEEIVGEIEDEFDTSEIMVQELEAGRYCINGKARLDLVNEQCRLQLHAPDAETIAGWVIAQLGSLPREGDVVKAGPVRVTVRKVVRNRVRELLLETRVR